VKPPPAYGAAPGPKLGTQTSMTQPTPAASQGLQLGGQTTKPVGAGTLPTGGLKLGGMGAPSQGEE